MSNKVKLYGGINLAQGIPGFKPPVGLIQCLSDVALSDCHQYAPANGDKKLIEKVIQNYTSFFRIDEENLLITQGATEAITLVMIYLKNKLGSFNVMGLDPLYESYRYLPGIFGMESIAFKSYDNDIDFENLENTIQKNNIRLLIIASPGNPYGKILTKEEMIKIVTMAERNDVFIVFDAVYRDFWFRYPPYYPFEFFNNNMFYVNSFSKKFSITGWRIGYLITNEEHMKNIRQIHDYTGLSASSVMQKAIAGFLDMKAEADEYVSSTRQNLIFNFNQLSQALTQSGFTIPQIDGGYFIWALLPEKFQDSFRFAIDLYEAKKVAVVPGIHFSPHAGRFIRLNIARTGHEISEAANLITQFCSEN